MDAFGFWSAAFLSSIAALLIALRIDGWGVRFTLVAGWLLLRGRRLRFPYLLLDIRR